MKSIEEIQELKRQLSREKQLNRIISAENNELRLINFGLLESIENKKWYKKTFFYRGLRKIYRLTLKRWTQNGK